MKRHVIHFLAVSLFLIVAVVAPAAATIKVSNYGETGWQTYTFTADQNGLATYIWLGVSNVGTTTGESMLLLDNFKKNGVVVAGFESGWPGSVEGDGATIASYAESYNGTGYTQTEGSFMAVLSASDSATVATFGGTTGAILYYYLELAPGETFSFDWNFLAYDESPNNDFAFLYAMPLFGAPAGGTTVQYGDFIKLAEIGSASVAEPGSLLLLGLGLAGLARLKRNMK